MPTTDTHTPTTKVCIHETARGDMRLREVHRWCINISAPFLFSIFRVTGFSLFFSLVFAVMQVEILEANCGSEPSMDCLPHARFIALPTVITYNNIPIILALPTTNTHRPLRVGRDDWLRRQRGGARPGPRIRSFFLPPRGMNGMAPFFLCFLFCFPFCSI